MRWSVALIAEGDQEMTREQIVELADAVADLAGIASGIGTSSYGAQLLVTADDGSQAIARATTAFVAAAARAGLPPWPATVVEVTAEDDEDAVAYDHLDSGAPGSAAR